MTRALYAAGEWLIRAGNRRWARQRLSTSGPKRQGRQQRGSVTRSLGPARFYDWAQEGWL